MSLFQFEKYPKIKQLGHEETLNLFLDPEDTVIIEEKIDGSNFRIFIKDCQLYFGSRNLTLEENNGQWLRCIKYVKQTLDDKDLLKLNGHILFGECTNPHTLKYNLEQIPPFLGFDVLTPEGKFLSHKNKIFQKLGLPIVPCLQYIKVKDITNVTDEWVPKSLYSDLQAEGIVFKNYKRQAFAKYVRAEFKEENKKVFGSSPKHSEDTERISLKYCTMARIEKNIFKLIDEGQKLDMPMMKYLPKKVYDDMVEECYKDILNEKVVLNLHKLRKDISSRCRNVLVQIIKNNAWKNIEDNQKI